MLIQAQRIDLRKKSALRTISELEAWKAVNGRCLTLLLV